MVKIIRPGNLKDINDLSSIHENCFPGKGWNNESIKNTLAVQSTFSQIVEIENKIAGFIIYRCVVDEAEIITICVLQSQRLKGFARELLNVAIAHIKSANVKKIFLEVAENNPAAIKFYEKESFKKYGKRSEYYSENGKNIDAILMSRPI